MSAHTNAEAATPSISEGVKIEGPGAFVGHQIGLVCTTAQSITMPGKGERQVIVQADGQDLRFRIDGATTAPTTTAGFLIKNGTSITMTAEDAAAAKFIAVAAAGLLNAWFAQ